LVGSRDHRTQFWKGAIQGPFHQSLVAIGPVVSTNLANFICVLFGTKESYFDSKFKFLLIRISRDHISLQYKRMGLTQASKNANSLIYHSYQENTLRKDGLCSKIKLLLAEIGFTHVWVNQGTFSRSKNHILIQNLNFF
jgi:hypothetical protein